MFETDIWGLSFFCVQNGKPEIGITYIELPVKLPALTQRTIDEALAKVFEKTGCKAVPVAVFPILSGS